VTTGLIKIVRHEMAVFGCKADVILTQHDVRYWPKTDIRNLVPRPSSHNPKIYT